MEPWHEGQITVEQQPNSRSETDKTRGRSTS